MRGLVWVFVRAAVLGFGGLYVIWWGLMLFVWAEVAVFDGFLGFV